MPTRNKPIIVYKLNLPSKNITEPKNTAATAMLPFIPLAYAVLGINSIALKELYIKQVVINAPTIIKPK